MVLILAKMVRITPPLAPAPNPSKSPQPTHYPNHPSNHTLPRVGSLHHDGSRPNPRTARTQSAGKGVQVDHPPPPKTTLAIPTMVVPPHHGHLISPGPGWAIIIPNRTMVEGMGDFKRAGVTIINIPITIPPRPLKTTPNTNAIVVV